MANTVAKRILIDGPRNVVVHYYLQSDGVEGELSRYVLLDPAVDLVPAMVPGMNLNLSEVWYELQGFTATLSFAGLVAAEDQPLWPLGPSASVHHDWKCFGGLKDFVGIDASGKVVVTTVGFTSAAARGAFVLRLVKVGT